jgi:hypothetical protein
VRLRNNTEHGGIKSALRWFLDHIVAVVVSGLIVTVIAYIFGLGV